MFLIIDGARDDQLEKFASNQTGIIKSTGKQNSFKYSAKEDIHCAFTYDFRDLVQLASVWLYILQRAQSV